MAWIRAFSSAVSTAVCAWWRRRAIFGVVDGVAEVLVVEPACVGQRGAD